MRAFWQLHLGRAHQSPAGATKATAMPELERLVAEILEISVFAHPVGLLC